MSAPVQPQPFADRGFTLRAAADGDAPAILDAFNRVFREKRSLAQWRWIYRDAPDGAEIMLCVAADGAVAAHYGAVRHRALLDGRPLRVAVMRDVFSERAYRGVRNGRRGVMAETIDAFFERWTGPGRIAFGYGFSNPRGFGIGRRLLKYRPFAGWWYGAATLRRELGARPVASGAAVTVGELKRFDERFDRLWRRDAERYRFAVVRDAAFLNWRFRDAPEADYWCWSCAPFLSREASGYLVVRARGEQAWLVDFHLPKRPAEALAFWREVERRLWSRGVRRVECWCSDIAQRLGGLEALGFLPLDRGDQLIPNFRAFDPTVDEAWADDHFHFTMADSDLY